MSAAVREKSAHHPLPHPWRPGGLAPNREAPPKTSSTTFKKCLPSLPSRTNLPSMAAHFSILDSVPGAVFYGSNKRSYGFGPGGADCVVMYESTVTRHMREVSPIGYPRSASFTNLHFSILARLAWKKRRRFKAAATFEERVAFANAIFDRL